jgi:HSP20 family protein
MLTLWRPFEALAPFRWVDEMAKGLLIPWPEEMKAAELPRFELTEEPERYVVVAELPGFKPEEVKVEFVGKQITVEGKHEEKGEKEGETYQRFETFKRTFGLPENAAPEKITAEMGEGLLKLIVPKLEVVKQVAVPVEPKKAETGAPIAAAKVPAEKVA